jgi:hypothetical protein
MYINFKSKKIVNSISDCFNKSVLADKCRFVLNVVKVVLLRLRNFELRTVGR